MTMTTSNTEHKHDLLFEIGTEELPPKIIKSLSLQLANNLCEQLQQAKLTFSKAEHFGTPRRLAVLIRNLDDSQEDYDVVRKGPSLKIAFDPEGNATQAALGFARSCGVNIEELQTEKNSKNECLVYHNRIKGEATPTLLPELCRIAIKKLMIPKPMRWGESNITFIRPVHWSLLLFGDQFIESEFLGTISRDKTYGHRFHHPEAILLKNAAQYEETLKREAFVIPSFLERRKNIDDQIRVMAKENGAVAKINETLLDEVTGLVEWPVALLIDFDKKYLNVPKEALISALQTHQKAFHLMDRERNLLPKFITISNIKSRDPQRVIDGNARVVRARLADAAFFYETDCRHSLESRLDRLKAVVFQKKLGNLYERAQRISHLSVFIAEKLKVDPAVSARAGLLAKADLVSDMVQEFPELQGIMGYYYARNDDLPEEITLAIRDHYQPRFSSDRLPETPHGCIVSLADRLDKLVGIFGINQQPTGEKDPFALRRAAIGALHILIQNKFNLDLKELLEKTVEYYKDILINPNVVSEVLTFFMERLKHWYQNQGVTADIFNSVRARNITVPYDFHRRINAVKTFCDLPQAKALAAANKRVSNILIKEGIAENLTPLSEALFELDAEKKLSSDITAKRKSIQPFIASRDYTAILTALADLQQPIDCFFDDVMVMVEDEKVRNNRLALLLSLRELFLDVADISKLNATLQSNETTS